MGMSELVRRDESSCGCDGEGSNDDSATSAVASGPVVAVSVSTGDSLSGPDRPSEGGDGGAVTGEYAVVVLISTTEGKVTVGVSIGRVGEGAEIGEAVEEWE